MTVREAVFRVSFLAARKQEGVEGSQQDGIGNEVAMPSFDSSVVIAFRSNRWGSRIQVLHSHTTTINLRKEVAKS
jgi:hypothetical protein